MNIKQGLEKLKELVIEWGLSDVYLVGGCVRDDLLGITPKDIDLVINYPDGSNLFTEFSKEKHSDICNGFTIFPKFGTSRFTLDLGLFRTYEIECVIPRKESYEGCCRKPNQVEYSSILEDALRRDFCCNALYKNIITGELLDPTGRGLDDLKNKILQTPLDPEATFKDDPLRMLRAIRFSVCKGFEISSSVLEKIKPIPEYYSLSMERIRDEFEKILLSKTPTQGIAILKRCGLLEYIVEPLDKNWKNIPNTIKWQSILRRIHDNPNSYNNLELLWAALLINTNNSADILKRLKYSNDFIKNVVFLIENHKCLQNLYDKETKKYIGKPEKTKEIIIKLGELLEPELILIDACSSFVRLDGLVDSFKEEYQEIMKYIPTNKDLIQPISGEEIMKTFSLSPGKLIGEIKDIFQMWYNENPKVNLLEKYKSEFEGKHIWVNYLGARITEEYSVPMKVDLEPGEYDAFLYPKLYIELQRFKKVWEIIHNTGEELGKLLDVPEFNKVELSFDSYNDLTGKVILGDKSIQIF